MLENTEGAIKNDNPEKLATQCTQDTGQINVSEYRRGNTKWQSRETGNIVYTRRRKTKQSKNTAQVTSGWDYVRFVLEKHDHLGIYSASSLTQQSVGRHVGPIGHAILISDPSLLLLLNVASLAEKEYITIVLFTTLFTRLYVRLAVYSLVKTLTWTHHSTVWRFGPIIRL